MVVDLQELARRMLADYDATTPCQVFGEPLDLTTVQAYALQTEIARLREQRGEKVIGYKVGCTSPAVQQQLGIAEPIFARVFDTGCFLAGEQLSFSRFANLAVEGELAVRLGQDVAAPSLGADECRAAIASVFPVIELHHYVLRGPRPALAELIASGGMHAGFVLAEHEVEGGLRDLDNLSVWIDDERIGMVSGADVTELAVRSVGWLAERLAEKGLSLARGHVVLTGSLLPLYTLSPGSRVVAALAPLGRSSAVIVP
ncbi:MAG TPA: fumarylacetoacetate hydrolase family protein [Gemmataceae bacterium]|nr:fumarylacetoacetate hydrolase family protein [Gemmataceae bacterium]